MHGVSEMLQGVACAALTRHSSQVLFPLDDRVSAEWAQGVVTMLERMYDEHPHAQHRVRDIAAVLKAAIDSRDLLYVHAINLLAYDSIQSVREFYDTHSSFDEHTRHRVDEWRKRWLHPLFERLFSGDTGMADPVRVDETVVLAATNFWLECVNAPEDRVPASGCQSPGAEEGPTRARSSPAPGPNRPGPSR